MRKMNFIIKKKKNEKDEEKKKKKMKTCYVVGEGGEPKQLNYQINWRR